MSIIIKDTKNNMDKLLGDLSQLSELKVEVGFFKEDDELLLIKAFVNEFGITMKMTDKQRRKLFALISEYKEATGDTDVYKAENPGHITIPERKFLRNTADDTNVQNKLADVFEFYFNEYLQGKRTLTEPLNRVGNTLRNEIQATITNQVPPENSELTKFLKGHDKTLIGETGELYKSIKVKVIKE